MKLFASLTSPFARKIRVILVEKSLPFKFIAESPWETSTRLPELNPLGQVPALVTPQGEVFFDSPVIAGYLETLEAKPSLLPEGGIERVRVRQNEALADGITEAAACTFLENRRPEGQRSADYLARQEGKIRRGLAELERRIAGRQWLNGDSLQLGDIAAGVALGYLDLRFAHLDWRGAHPELEAFSRRVFARPGFIASMPPAAG